jgi:uncharacterized membrane protein YhaH (DUF805 family)
LRDTVSKNSFLLETWRLSDYEAWFADMAREGLLVKEMLRSKVRFTPGTPQELQYRLLDCSRKDKKREILRCENRGWTLVNVFESYWQRRSRSLLILSAPPHIPPLKMDVREKAAVEQRMQNTIWNRGVILLLLLLATVTYAAHTETDKLYPRLWLIFFTVIIVALFVQIITMFSAWRRWKDPQVSSLPPNWRTRRRIGFIATLSLIGAWLLLMVVPLLTAFGGR